MYCITAHLGAKQFCLERSNETGGANKFWRKGEAGSELYKRSYSFMIYLGGAVVYHKH